jgi:Ca2+-binding RTX toxin-like protein
LATGTKQSSETSDDVVAVTIEGTGDVSITDGGSGSRTGTNDDIEGLALTVNGSAARTIELGSDKFLNSLTVVGTASGALAFTNVEADEIDMTALTAAVTVTLTDDDDKVIELGSGNDVLNALADTVDEDDLIDGGGGTDRLIVDAFSTATNLTENDDEVFESMSSIEEVELRSGADVVLDDDANDTGVTTVIVDSTSTAGSTISIQSDFERALAVTSESASVTVIDNDADVDLTVTVEQLGADTTLTLTDAGKGAVSVTVTADDVVNTISGAATGDNDLVITAAAGSIDTLVVKDSKATASTAAVSIAGAVTVTTDAAWAGAGETLVIDVSDLNDDDLDANADGDKADAGDIDDTQTVTINASASTAGDYKVNVKGSALVDTVTGTANADTIDGAGGADVITGALGADTLTGGSGADTFNYTAVSQSTGATTDTITDFTTGSDKIKIAFTSDATTTDVSGFANNKASVADSLVTLSGTSTTAVAGDWFYATSGSIAVDVNGDGAISDGTDYLIDVTGAVAAADVNFVITGGAAANTITGGAGADTIDGGAGADTIKGGAGIDTLTGGAGDDTFVIGVTTAADADNIVDFDAEDGTVADLLNFDISDMGLNAADFAAGAVTIVNAAAANALAAGAASNHIIVDTLANIATMVDADAAWTGGAIAIASDTGNIYYDADGDFSAGSVIIGSITAVEAAALVNGNMFIIA